MGITTKLIVLAAFHRDDEGNLASAFDPREMPDEARAKNTAALLQHAHAGVSAWSRSADLPLGDYGPPTVLVVYGDVPDME